ncbi:MAG: LuxR C-terminal-related transcriptional regulator [Rikenellaceae bacterium]
MNHTTMNRAVPLIIVLTPNTLTSVGLRNMLTDILPFAAVKVCDSIEDLQQFEASDIFHIFVSSQILIENIALFESLRAKCIVLTNGSVNTAALQEFHQINIQQSESEILSSIRALHTHAHGARGETQQPLEKCELLSPREIEVTKLLVEGLINKEIANQLDISITTVITHRKNIFEKLGIRSIAGLTIYAIMKRYIEI